MQPEWVSILLIYLSVGLSLLWALFLAISVIRVKIQAPHNVHHIQNEVEKDNLLNSDKLATIKSIGKKISKGANAFLFAEYLVMLIFIIIFGALVFIIVDWVGQNIGGVRFYGTFAYLVGALTSMLCGYIGMKIAVAANYRTTFKAISSLEDAFSLAIKAGCVMGFTTVAIGLGILISLILAYNAIFNPDRLISSDRSWGVMMEFIAAYSLGGSTMALFGRVGGGIYTKAADVGADLVGKVEHDLDEDSPRNPATIADNVGDNVGDIAGMGSDLFGSFAGSTCAALVIIANNASLIRHKEPIYFPLLINAYGLFAAIITSFIGIYIYKVNTKTRINRALILQLIIATFFAAIGICIASLALPTKWRSGHMRVRRWEAILVTLIGLIAGLLIGISTNYFTSYNFRPVRDVADSCNAGAAINIIYGLALGYLSTIIPVILIAITLIVAIKLVGMLGTAIAAIGMLSTLVIGLAIDAYGPVSDNAGGISEMSELSSYVRDRTDALDSAGNTTAAIGKGFAIGSAALVSVALYQAFLTRARKLNENRIERVEITNPWVIGMLFIGAMLPYAFSALTMKSVGYAAQDMVREVRRQFQNEDIRNGIQEPDYQQCISVSTKASLREMILPGVLVLLTPLFFGLIFHPILVAGLLPGAFISGVALAISMSNTGGAWDNTKKYIESGQFSDEQGITQKKGSPQHKAAVIGDTVGDPLKDTSGPSLNILIKLMAIISLVFVSGFSETSWLSGPFDIY